MQDGLPTRHVALLVDLDGDDRAVCLQTKLPQEGAIGLLSQLTFLHTCVSVRPSLVKEICAQPHEIQSRVLE